MGGGQEPKELGRQLLGPKLHRENYQCLDTIHRTVENQPLRRLGALGYLQNSRQISSRQNVDRQGHHCTPMGECWTRVVYTESKNRREISIAPPRHDPTLVRSCEFAAIVVVSPGECGHIPILPTHIHNQGLGLACGQHPHRQGNAKGWLGQRCPASAADGTGGAALSTAGWA